MWISSTISTFISSLQHQHTFHTLSSNTIFVTLMTSIPNYLSTCNHHPTVSITGTAFCSFCLHERLAGFHSSPTSTHSSSPDNRRSCEIQVRNSLSDLISLADERIDLNQNPENSGLQFMEAEHADDDEDEETVTIRDEVDKETMTMKEFIDLESQIRKKHVVITDLRSFRVAVNAFSEKLLKWKWKHKLTKNRNGNDNRIVECNLRRRSCDADPTSSMEARRGSVDWPRGLIGRAILCSCSCSCQCPCSRVSPMVSVMEDSNSNNIDNQKLKKVLNVRSSESFRQKLVRSYSLSCRIRMTNLVNNTGDSDQRRGRQEFLFYLARLKSYRRSKSANSSSSTSI